MKQRQWRDAAYQLAHHGWLRPLPYATQDYLSAVGTVHSKLGSHLSIAIRKMTDRHAVDPSECGNSSVEVPSSRMSQRLCPVGS